MLQKHRSKKDKERLILQFIRDVMPFHWNLMRLDRRDKIQPKTLDWLFVTRIFHNCLKYFKSSSSVAIQDGFKVPVRKGKLCQGLLRADIKLLLD